MTPPVVSDHDGESSVSAGYPLAAVAVHQTMLRGSVQALAGSEATASAHRDQRALRQDVVGVQGLGDGVEQDLSQLDEDGRAGLRRHAIGIVHQSSYLFPWLSVNENLEIGPDPRAPEIGRAHV